MKNPKKVFLIAGRTGGPIMPVVAIAKKLKNIEPIIIGVKGGFEDAVVKQSTGWKLLTLPEAKLYFLSFSKKNLYDYITETGRMIKSIAALIWSLLKSVFYIFKYKPSMIIGAGSFLSVPVITATRVANWFRKKGNKIKIVIHQQDPDPGFSNKLTVSAANIVTCSHESTKKYKGFKYCQVMPNPLDLDRFEPENIAKQYNKMKETDLDLYKFLTKTGESDKPLLFIFGGGSGSRFINTWVAKTADQLQKKFNILHLKGTLQEEYPLPENSENYMKLEYLADQYPVVMTMADLVISRAGLSSITELLYLQKPAIIVPLFNSHQEKNVKEIEQYFEVFMQRKEEIDQWGDRINKIYPTEFAKIQYPDPKQTKAKLEAYYKQIQNLLDA